MLATGDTATACGARGVVRARIRHREPLAHGDAPSTSSHSSPAAPAKLGDAEDLEHAALARCHAAGLLPQVAISLEALAAIALEHESAAEATRLFGAAAALRSSIGMVRWPIEQPAYDADARSRRRTVSGPRPSARHGTKGRR